ncbi:hypothetical protein G7054_g9175 [Neopestalotiopsis clavispora]|nr:hypothetical protein G7054_g9175 [Neopestalotiopsis clavispora]
MHASRLQSATTRCVLEEDEDDQARPPQVSMDGCVEAVIGPPTVSSHSGAALAPKKPIYTAEEHVRMTRDEASAINDEVQSALQIHIGGSNGEYFLPMEVFSQLFTKSRVRTLLEEAGNNRAADTQYLASVMRKALKTLVILVCIQDVAKFQDLFPHFDDTSLPIGRELKKANKRSSWRVATLGPDDKFDPQKSHPVFDSLGHLSQRIQQYQWWFLEAEFSKFYQKFHPKQPLPFLANEFKKIGDGHFSNVFKAKSPSSLARMFSAQRRKCPKYVAVKKFTPRMRDYFFRELNNLERLNVMRHHHLIEPLTTFEHGEEQYIMYTWESGGNLREFWKSPSTARPSITWILEQMHGISHLLKRLHEGNDQGHCRHGDIKPENILLRRGSGKKGDTLILADVGLTKFHRLATLQRQYDSSVKDSTLRYEAPEINVDQVDTPTRHRSRRYDIWSIGCVYLEFIIWFVYGNETLRKFNSAANEHKFWAFKNLEYDDSEVKGGAKVLHPTVQRMIRRLLQDLPAHSALRDLVNMIQNGLLVIRLEDRWFASKMLDTIGGIRNTAQADKQYALDSMSPRPPSLPADETGLHDECATSLTVNRTFDTQARNVEDVWTGGHDNKFARELFRQFEWSKSRPELLSPKLCSDCQRIDVRTLRNFRIEAEKLQQRPFQCDFCEMCYKSSEGKQISDRVVRFNGTDPSSLISVYVDPESTMELPSHVSIGFPQLPEPGSEGETLLLQQWVRNCDENHACMPSKDLPYMPTRVIDVLADSKDKLRLVETSNKMKGRYIAVSHCWGNIPDSKKFRLLKENLDTLKENIDYAQLPQTFQDVVDVSRQLEVQYLWLDSICIIQNDTKDWASESTKMESVYSSSYVTIAASSAASSLVGLPKQRPERPCVRIGDFYFAENIDNFENDVEKAVLNSRGWVFQEHALSRRCIHFTSGQIYWECGDGIHCETLAKLSNPYAAFLGDAKFPSFAEEYFKGGKILHFQEIFKVYSKLAFSEKKDRSKALQGLESRLAQTMGKVQYGIIENMLGRTLLWRAATPRSMERITYDGDRDVPSWSWMAYWGAIAYLDVPFDDTEWCLENIRNPFGADRSVLAKDFEPEAVRQIVFDEAGTASADAQKCVVIGKQNSNTATEKRAHYVLIIHPSTVREGCYRRVGVGRLEERQISNEAGCWLPMQ